MKGKMRHAQSIPAAAERAQCPSLAAFLGPPQRDPRPQPRATQRDAVPIAVGDSRRDPTCAVAPRAPRITYRHESQPRAGSY